MFALLLAAVSFHSNFEGGSIGPIEEVTPGHYRCHVRGETDQDNRNRQASWYYFRIDGARGRRLTLDFVDLPGEYNYQPNRGAIIAETLPFWSENRETWRMVDDAQFAASVPLLRVRITPSADRVWIAHVPPYTGVNLKKLLDEHRNHPALRIASVGKTVQGRDMHLLTVSEPSVDDDRKVLWLMFRQHSWEAGSSWAAEGALRFLLSDDLQAARIRRGTIFKIFPMCDPDGVARGGVRFNANGYDLNRNWDAVDPGKMPEIASQRKAIWTGWTRATVSTCW